jgi:hypothetical protein
MPKTFASLVLALQLCGAALAQPPRPAPIFRFETDEFWLNLHHFLYVLGRAEAKTPDSARAAVAGAPAEVQEGLQDAGEAERQAWSAAVATYAAGVSRKDAVFHDSLAALTKSLTAATLPDGIDPDVRAALERAAPVYRSIWWPKHRAANRQWLASTQALVDRHGRAILDFITKAYGMPWPAAGYPVHVSGYTNWAGAYSTTGDLLVVASNAGSGTRGLDGLETVFHEAMHQWDDRMDALLRIAANGRPPRSLSHALIFFTAGEAVRRVAPDHVPYADAYGVWDRGWTSLKAALVQTWKPYLDGKGTRDEALAAAAGALK